MTLFALRSTFCLCVRGLRFLRGGFGCFFFTFVATTLEGPDTFASASTLGRQQKSTTATANARAGFPRRRLIRVGRGDCGGFARVTACDEIWAASPGDGRRSLRVERDSRRTTPN